MHQLLRHTLAIADASVDDALAAALPTADAAAQRICALALLQRRHPSGLVGLVRAYHLLPEDVRQTIVHHAGDLTAALRHAAHPPPSAGNRPPGLLDVSHDQGPANALDIIERSRSVSLAYLINEHLRRGPDHLRPQAAKVLLAFADVCSAAADPAHRPALDAVAGEQVAAAVRDAVNTYTIHQQPQVLLALCALWPRFIPGQPQGRQSIAIIDALADSSHPLIAPLTDLISHACEHPRIRRALLVLLGAASLSQAVRQAIQQCAARGVLAEIFDGAHLLLLPGVRGRLGNLDAPESVIPTPEQIKAMAAWQQRAVPRWIACLPLTIEQQTDSLTALAAASDPAARLFALRQLISLTRANPAQRPAILTAIAAFCRDDYVAIARIALWQLIHYQPPELTPLLGELVNSPHPEIRRIVGKHLAPRGFSRLWDSWPRIPPPRRLAAGRALIKIDPDFHRQLGLKLAGKDPKTRLQALAMIGDLNQGALFETTLIDLLHDKDSKVASAATTALGSAGTESAADALAQALEHQDSRVRANAVEALSQVQSTQNMHRLVAMAHEDENRPRANAIAALMHMDTGHALSALKQMLQDPRPKHRLSALWLAQSMGLFEVAHSVAELSITDTDENVKQHAGKAIEQLLEVMSPAPTQAGHASACVSSAPNRVPAVAVPALFILAFDYEQVTRAWGTSSNMPSLPVMCISVALVLVLLASLIALRRYRTRADRSRPLTVFHRIARNAELSWSDQWLLWRIARQQNLPTPLTLLLSPRTLHVHARAYLGDVARTARRKRSRVLPRVRKIRHHLRG